MCWRNILVSTYIVGMLRYHFIDEQCELTELYMLVKVAELCFTASPAFTYSE